MDSLLERHPAAVARRRFDVEAYYRMAEVGILGPDERVELIEGEIVAMAAIGADHARASTVLTRMFVLGAGREAVVRVALPVRLDPHNEPEPDLALVRPHPTDYADRHPGPADVLLLVEVSHTSLRVDRAVKAPLYARHGIPEYWIVDLVGRALERHRDPVPDGYRLVDRLGPGEGVAPAALPGLVVPLAEVLG